MERDVEEENELVTLWINDRELDVKKILNSKEVLNCYFQKFQLDKPVYQVRVVNEGSTQYRIFMLTLELMAKRFQHRGKVKGKQNLLPHGSSLTIFPIGEGIPSP